MEENVYRCDIGKFNKQTYTYIAEFGLFSDVAYETDQDLKNILGHLAYLLEGVKRLFDIHSYHIKVTTEYEIFEYDFMYGMITNSRSVGGFKNLTGKNVDMNDGLFEVTLITTPKNPMDMQEIIAGLMSGKDNSDLIYTFKTSRIRIQSDEAVAWTLDGEYGGDHKEVEIRNLHRALNLYLTGSKNS